MITLQMFNHINEGPGVASTSTYTGEILIMLLGAFVLGYLLRHFLNSSLNAKIVALEAELEQCKNAPKITQVVKEPNATNYAATANHSQEINQLKSDLAQANALIASFKAEPNNVNTLENINRDLNGKITEVVSLKTEVANLKANLEACETHKTSLMASLAKIEPAQKDDLKKIEGIGPKIQQLMYDAGIYTFKELSETPVDKLKDILNAAGDRYKIHDPSTWPQQSALAADGKWDEFKALQDRLNGGKV